MMRFAQIIVAGVLAGFVAVPALADDRIAVSYDVSLGGSRIMKASYAVDIAGDSYRSELEAKTTGMSKLFSKIRLNLSASGSVADDGVVPQRYDYSRKKNDKFKERKLAFSQSGELMLQGQDYDATIVKALSKQVMDPLSMLLKLSRSDTPCKGKHRAFDGRDVFDVTLSGGSTAGETVTCAMVYKPVAGGDVEDGDTEPKAYEITLLRVGGGKGHVPLRITGSVNGVGFEVNARAVTVNGADLAF
jgi:Protein of unknown function (DUF3108)